jgi:hypothetical protein
MKHFIPKAKGVQKTLLCLQKVDHCYILILFLTYVHILKRARLQKNAATVYTESYLSFHTGCKHFLWDSCLNWARICALLSEEKVFFSNIH